MKPRFEPVTGRYMHLEMLGRPHRLYVEEAGKGVPLLCLHTAGADGRQYRGVMNDPRVSRMHAKLSWYSGKFHVEDVSSFGTWVRFTGSDTDVPLRRDDCQLHGTGEIALGMPFNDISAPTVQFSFSPHGPSFYGTTG